MITWEMVNDYPQIKAFTTLRQTLPGEINPRFTGNPENKTEENRRRLAQILGIDALQLVFPRQTHTSNVSCLSEVPSRDLVDTDALVTNQRNICLCVQTADCVPLLIYDPLKNTVAAVHAGWRGTVGLIAREVVQQFRTHFSSNPCDIRVIMGPSIGPDVYEVGDEVVNAVKKFIPNSLKSLNRQPSGKFFFNLWEANRQILMACGVPDKNIEISGYCTYSEYEHFFSARREGIETGRLVTGIMLLNV